MDFAMSAMENLMCRRYLRLDILKRFPALAITRLYGGAQQARIEDIRLREGPLKVRLLRLRSRLRFCQLQVLL